MIIGISIALLYCVLLGLSAVVQRNIDEYTSNGYIDINLKWLIFNVLYFIGQTLFVPVKYVITLVIVVVMLCIIIVLAVVESNDMPDGLPEFMEDWFYADGVFYSYIGKLLSVIWGIVLVVITALSYVLKFLFVSPFVWIKKHVGNIFDVSFFTIGNKPKNKK